MSDHTDTRGPQESAVPVNDPRLQLPPVLYRPDGNTALLANLYREQSAFLICGGPSLAKHDLSKLQQRGILTCSVNNAATVFRSTLWVAVDPPGNFCDAIWRDPAITKFVPLARMEETLRVHDASGDLEDCTEKVLEMPAVFGLRLQNGFRADRFLTEPVFTWGNGGLQTDANGNTGVRSVMFVALKLLFVLGVKRVFLLGCDFRMSYGDQNYAFAQHRTRRAVRWNNHAYRVLSVRLKELKPRFEAAGCSIFNCTPKSGLTVFPQIRFEQAVEEVLSGFPRDIRTEGMYGSHEKKNCGGD